MPRTRVVGLDDALPWDVRAIVAQKVEPSPGRKDRRIHSQTRRVRQRGGLRRRGGIGELEMAIERKGDGEYVATNRRWVGGLEVPKKANVLRSQMIIAKKKLRESQSTTHTSPFSTSTARTPSVTSQGPVVKNRGGAFALAGLNSAMWL